ncbi:murein L,D-transpeptidase catalytic domain family protein [Xanthomonas sp. XNM01]|uniref:murein L,D-transpeptidase catalytic domain family protein n=1 Tax=Xanthomonas sp. XNM01 TaxID=2769289 RepID=UPI0031BB918E
MCAPAMAGQPTPAASGLAERLARQAPAADAGVLRLAAQAMRCALRHPEFGIDPQRLGVIDYSRPSTEPRLWIFDLARQQLLFEEWVAHGRNSGDNLTTRFSNREGSYMSSLGGFAAQETYVGGNGYSLRLRGLEPGFNDQARERAIVIHGAPYVNPAAAKLQGRLGRSLGCPAVRPQVARELIDTLRDGTFVFAYYPDQDWLAQSRLLQGACGGSGAGTPHTAAAP